MQMIIPITKPIAKPIKALSVDVFAIKKPAVHAPTRIAKATRPTKKSRIEKDKTFYTLEN